MKEQVHIVLVSNDRYRQGLLATRHSMTASCAEPERLVFHELGDADLAPFLGRIPLDDYNGSKLPYMRLFLPEILPACDWVIYADVDTLWFRDPCELWDERDDSKSIAWVGDLDTSGMDFRRWTASVGLRVRIAGSYACSGVALINLGRWRETGFTSRAIAFIGRYGCPPYADQDVMNALLAGDAKMLDGSWDAMIPSWPPRPCVLHVTGLGLRLGPDHYVGDIPQYVFWFAYWRRFVRRLPRQAIDPRALRKFRMLSVLAGVLSRPLAFADRFRGPYAVKLFLMRLRRQLAWSRVVLLDGFGLSSFTPLRDTGHL